MVQVSGNYITLRLRIDDFDTVRMLFLGIKRIQISGSSYKE